MKSTRILIIEDNIVTLGDLEMRIGQMGYEEIETAVTGEEAIEIAARFGPDIILSDIHLGEGMNGIEAVKKIKETQNVPVVYLTAYDDDQTLDQAGITEPYAYLIKPLQERELQIALSIALYKHNAENELKELNAIKDRFISILGHDLRNSFNSLIGFSDLLLAELDDYDKNEIRNIVNIISKTSNQTYDLLNNLLEWSKSQQGKIPFNPQIVSMYDLIQSSVGQVNLAAEAKQIQIQSHLDKKIEAEVDSDMIRTVIRNLLTNAIKFTPENGRIEITMHEKEGLVHIGISDTGIGMNDKVKDSLFHIGETRSQAGTKGEPGTGFGLLLCKEFVDKHQGSIAVESEIDKGSRFTISFPGRIE